MEELLLSKKNEYIINNFSRLMGFEAFKEIPEEAGELLKEIVSSFDTLSRKCYPLHKDLSAKNLNLYEYSPFDFSNFFRMYPLLRFYKAGKKELLEYLIGFLADIGEFKLEDFNQDTADNKFLFENVITFLDKNYIHSKKELSELLCKCNEFIKKYEKLFTIFESCTEKTPTQVLINAYLFNEDRGRMMHPYSIAGPIDDNRRKLKPSHVNNILNAVINSNKRSGSYKICGYHVTNFEIYFEGFFATLLNNDMSHKVSLNLFDNFFDYDENDVYTVKINNKKYICNVIKEGNLYSIQSPSMPNSYLLKDEYKKLNLQKTIRKFL